MLIVKLNRGGRISDLLATLITNSHSPFHLLDFENIGKIGGGFAKLGPVEQQGDGRQDHAPRGGILVIVVHHGLKDIGRVLRLHTVPIGSWGSGDSCNVLIR